MSVELSFAPNAEAGVKERSEGEHAGPSLNVLERETAKKGCLPPGDLASLSQEAQGERRWWVVTLPAPCAFFVLLPGAPAAQQELSVVSGTLPELQGAGQSGHRARAVEEAPRQVPSAQEVE